MIDGTSAFERAYEEWFGARWEGLRASLLLPPPAVAVANPWAGPPPWRRGDELAEAPGCVIPAFPKAAPGRGDDGLLRWHRADLATVLAVRALGVEPGHRVLDLCAAPGNAALILAGQMGQTGRLTLNDIARGPSRELRTRIFDSLPRSTRSRVKLTARDGRRWGLQKPASFDRVLVDPPSSDERRWVFAGEFPADWTAGFPRQIARRQTVLLASGLRAARSGGRVVYMTRALTALENDDVVEQVVAGARGRARVEPADAPIGDPTRYGRWVAPDRGAGWGPRYWAVLRIR